MEETLADERAQLEEDMESMLATIRGKKRLKRMSATCPIMFKMSSFHLFGVVLDYKAW